MKDWLRYNLYVALVSLVATIAFCLPDYAVHAFQWSCLFYLGAIGLGIYLLCYIILLSRWVSYVFLPFFFFTGSVLTYYHVSYAVTLSPFLIGATLHTNPNEAAGVISWPLVLLLVTSLLVVIGLCYLRSRLNIKKWFWIPAPIAVIAMVVFYHFFYIGLNQHYPYNVYCNVRDYIALQHQPSGPRLQQTHHLGMVDEELQVIVILGEASRADHLSINGYARKTTPLLEERLDQIVSYPNVYTPYTFTAQSLPYILAPANGDCPVEGQYESFIHYAKEQGFYTGWISNHDMGQLCYEHIALSDTIIMSIDRHARIGQRVDENMLEGLMAVKEKVLSSSNRGLYVLHAMGSHWYYENYVPSDFRPFKPSLGSRILKENSVEQIINAYDNTIAYQDLFTDQVIRFFEQENAILFYLSDHGEALGEDGKWFHGTDTKPEHNPACFVWYSDRYKVLHPDRIDRLKENRAKNFRTNFLFYTLLETMGITIEDAPAHSSLYR